MHWEGAGEKHTREQKLPKEDTVIHGAKQESGLADEETPEIAKKQTQKKLFDDFPLKNRPGFPYSVFCYSFHRLMKKTFSLSEQCWEGTWSRCILMAGVKRTQSVWKPTYSFSSELASSDWWTNASQFSALTPCDRHRTFWQPSGRAKSLQQERITNFSKISESTKLFTTKLPSKKDYWKKDLRQTIDVWKDKSITTGKSTSKRTCDIFRRELVSSSMTFSHTIASLKERHSGSALAQGCVWHDVDLCWLAWLWIIERDSWPHSQGHNH